MTYLPLLRQFLVVSSPQLAALSVGGVIGYPNVLLQQLRANDSTIQLNLDIESWIGSIHGLAAIPSILMATLMQWQGRKIAFLTSCLLISIGWILAYVATSTPVILISESFHGLGGGSLIIVSFSSISEMVDPKYRNIFMVSYCIMQALGIASVGIMGQYLHWKTVSLIFLFPVFLGFLNASILWPESPSWLALNGKVKECEKTFKWLRGEDPRAEKELLEILFTHREKVKSENLINTLSSRSFYIPAFLIFILLNSSYWSGVTVIIIYAIDIIRKTSGNNLVASYGMIAMDILLFICYNVCVILVKRFSNKSIILLSTLGTISSLLFCSFVTYLQSINVLGECLMVLYGLIAFIISCTLGLTPIVFSMAMEIMPVKHRGVGGSCYVIFMAILHTSSLKSAPYMFIYLDYWGTFLVYAINAIFCLLIIWKYVPETKNRTLQELEDYFTHGKFVKRYVDVEEFSHSIRQVDEHTT